MNGDHHMVFVGGLHRSGTTPLARCLAAHPDVSGFSGTGAQEDEGQHLQDLIPPAGSFGGPGRFALDPRSRLTESSSLARPESAERLFARWMAYWDLSRPVLLEKSPPNMVRMRFLQHLFPNSSFVMVVRHPVVVALSTHKWAPRTSYSKLFANWFAAHDILVKDAGHIRRLHVLKYEDLVRDPATALSGIADFIGVEQPIPHDSLQSGRSSGYAATWQSWTQSQAPWHRRRVSRLKQRYAARVERYGYSLSDLETARPLVLEQCRN